MSLRSTLTRGLPALLATSALLAGGVAVAAPATTAAPPDIPIADVQAHLTALNDVAAANGGNRAHGQPGQKATIDFLKATLDEAGFETSVQEFEVQGATGYNLIADWTAGDANQVLMLGGHSDGVEAGPAINDNGTGSAALLEVALTVAEQQLQPAKKLRFGWWGAEELGLVGSTEYVESLPQAERDKITGYLNFDMLGSPNAGYFAYDPSDQPEGSAELQAPLNEFLAGAGVQTEDTAIGGRSDHAAFADAGIPTAGLFSGAEDVKTEAQAELWGGTAGEAFDPCYHQACDTLDNIDVESLDKMTDAVAHAAWTLAG
ncbi:peptidase M28 [Amycolatopsis antarctica]|uniref:Peptidase M28 n=1 Tax=Amycolatopsis antarctica TaxID=1854586 RepID=A0A263D7N9_9PSEU|nr:M28 family metallopeptidase [Amycolatopsis antarctica]OZM74522.1 peptidase M28 [Amycolatopsis antarctica]